MSRGSPTQAGAPAQPLLSRPRMYPPRTGAGSVWATDPEGRRLFRLDPRANQVVAATQLPAEPNVVAAGEGALWVHAMDAGQLLRVEPQP